MPEKLSTPLRNAEDADVSGQILILSINSVAVRIDQLFACPLLWITRKNDLTVSG